MSSTAKVQIDLATLAAEPLTRYLTGKFCEHLGSNIYNGMSAQVLRNPTFARMEFDAQAGDHPDGGARYECRSDAIRASMEKRAERDRRFDGAAQFAAWRAGLAWPWIAEGQLAPLPAQAGADDPARVRVTPDVSSHGRAQRVETGVAGQGIAQVTRLPLHRCRQYFARVMARAAGGGELAVVLFQGESATVLARSQPMALTDAFTETTVTLALAEDLPPETLVRVAVVLTQPGDVVIGRVELFPSDHVDEADPDVVRFLRESRLPILRWPGGNFVSGYNWRDGIGPREQRPGRVNPAWGGVESNLFGLHEFIDFCRHVGCEPMICVNAGTGTPEEAADWVEYCNGSARTPLGKLRKKNGKAKPFNIRFWEIGNELTGYHQINWTTPRGYTDRYGRFAKAMLARDPALVLPACGAPVDWQEDWNPRLFKTHPQMLRWITDHILRGSTMPTATDPRALYLAFMALPVWFEEQYRGMEYQMRASGIAAPRLAITELQLFARVAADGGTGPLTNQTLVSPETMAEAVYCVLFYHMAVRLAPFVGMITHSATVNHGGGLRKQSERVYADPCHYAQALFADFNGATALPVKVDGPEYAAPAGIQQVEIGRRIPAIDAIAARTARGVNVVSLVNRGLDAQTLELHPTGGGVTGATAQQLSAAEPWARNSLAQPEAIMPKSVRVQMENGILRLTLPPCSVTRLRLK